MQNLSTVSEYKSGFAKDAMRRALIASTEPWWQDVNSEWGVTIQHPIAPDKMLSPDFWQQRAMDLCTYEFTRSHFGLGYLDLMELDVSTFEEIEKRVKDMEARQRNSLKKEGFGTWDKEK